MGPQRKKVLYITNVNLDGRFLPGVVSKIRGQLKAMKDNQFDASALYPGNNHQLVFQKDNFQKTCKGAREVNPQSNFTVKLISHLKVSWLGSISFRNCYSDIIREGFDAVYLRFYLPGTGLLKFLNRLKKDSPSILVLLEYPTLNVVTEMKKRSMSSRLAYYVNRKKIMKLNSKADYIITLTKDKTLFGKPTIHMPNGIDLKGINPVATPSFIDEFVLIGVTSDCAFYHGFDKVIRGIAAYSGQRNTIKVLFRIISNPLSTYVDRLKNLARELSVSEQVSFELPKTREQLAQEYGRVHMGIGTLALHRIGLMDNYSLKHREYAAFGLPFVMSKGDDHFEQSPFVYTVERNDEAIDIKHIIDFYFKLRKNFPEYSDNFRKSVENKITWEAQMKEVLEVIDKGENKHSV